MGEALANFYFHIEFRGKIAATVDIEASGGKFLFLSKHRAGWKFT